MPQRELPKIRPLTDFGDHRIFDNHEHVEFVIRGDSSRDEIAAELAKDTKSLLEIGLRFGREFFKTPGEFCVEYINVHEKRTSEGVDFVMTCSFAPEDASEDFTYVVFDFGFRFKAEVMGRERIRCLRFAAAVC